MKLIGLARIGNDPELHFTGQGMQVLQLSLAYNYGREKKTQWISATLFGKRAEALANFLAKGQMIYAEVSDLHIDTYTNKEGVERTGLKGIVQDVGLTGRTEQAEQAPAPQRPTPQRPAQNIADVDDDIPF